MASSSSALPQPSSTRAGLPDGTLLIAGLCILLTPAALALARQTWRSEAGSLSPLILLFGFWTLWRTARDSNVPRHPGSANIWVPILAISLPLYVAALIIDSITLIAGMAWIVSVTAFYAMLGRAMIRQCGVPLVFLAMVVPLPYVISAQVNSMLRSWVSEWSVDLARAVGIDAALEYGNIAVNQYLLSVEAACAGVNSTLSLVAIALLFAFWVFRSRLSGVVVIAVLAIPIALMANLLRVLFLMALVDLSGPMILDGAIHPLSGVLSFTLALTMLLLVASTLGKRPALRKETPCPAAAK